MPAVCTSASDWKFFSYENVSDSVWGSAMALRAFRVRDLRVPSNLTMALTMAERPQALAAARRC